MYNVVSLRCSVFCTPIKYDKTLVAALNDVLPNFTPVIFRDNIILSSPLPWQLNSPDDSEMVTFVGDKIDFIKKINKEITKDDINFFIMQSQNVFEKIMMFSKQSYSRLAFAPSIFVAADNSGATRLFEKVFSVRKFENQNLAASNFSQVYRINKVIGSLGDIVINYAANFRLEPDVVVQEGRNQIRERYLGDFDINTFADPSYRFNVENMKKFFELTQSIFESFYNLYFDN